MLSYPLGEGLGRQGPRVQVPLPGIAFIGSQEGRLRYGFDAFGHHLALEPMGEGDDGPNDGRAILVSGQIFDERLIDLEGIEWEAPQVGQRRVAGTEIVDRELCPERA